MKKDLAVPHTIVPIGLSPGRLPPIRSCKRSPDFVRVFPGYNTSLFFGKQVV